MLQNIIALNAAFVGLVIGQLFGVICLCLL